MTLLVRVRLALLLVGVALFAYSLRYAVDWARWVAIGVLTIAIVLRFFDRNRPRRR